MNGLAHRIDSASTAVAETAIDLQLNGRREIAIGRDVASMADDGVIDATEQARLLAYAEELKARGLATYLAGERLGGVSAELENDGADLDAAINTLVNGRDTPLPVRAWRKAASAKEYQGRGKVVPFRQKNSRVSVTPDDAA